MKRFFLVLFFFSLTTLHPSLVTDAGALDVRRTVLPNGLVVLHVERHNLPTVMATLLVKASPLDEPADRAGLANLAAELITEGTKTRTSAAISEEIEFIGASLGASTDSDYTAVSLSVLKKDAATGFDLLSDVVRNPSFPEAEVRRVRQLIKGAIRQSEEDPSYIAGREFRKAVFPASAYGRQVAGEPESLDRTTRDELADFHGRFYRPNNAVLSVVGDLTAAELDSLLQRHFAGWQPGDIPPRAAAHKAEAGQRTVLIDRDLTQATVVLGHEGISRDNPDFYSVVVMNYILGGGGFSSRLMERVRDELGLAYDIHSLFAANRFAGLFQVNVQTKNTSANTVIAEVLIQIRRIRTEPVSDGELSDAKAYLTGSFPRRLDTNRKVADFLAAIEFYGLGLDYIEKYASYIRAVTKDDVLRVALKYLDPEREVMVVVARQAEAAIGKKEGR